MYSCRCTPYFRSGTEHILASSTIIKLLTIWLRNAYALDLYMIYLPTLVLPLSRSPFLLLRIHSRMHLSMYVSVCKLHCAHYAKHIK